MCEKYMLTQEIETFNQNWMSQVQELNTFVSDDFEALVKKFNSWRRDAKNDYLENFNEWLKDNSTFRIYLSVYNGVDAYVTDSDEYMALGCDDYYFEITYKDQQKARYFHDCEIAESKRNTQLMLMRRDKNYQRYNIRGGVVRPNNSFDYYYFLNVQGWQNVDDDIIAKQHFTLFDDIDVWYEAYDEALRGKFVCGLYTIDNDEEMQTFYHENRTLFHFVLNEKFNLDMWEVADILLGDLSVIQEYIECY